MDDRAPNWYPPSSYATTRTFHTLVFQPQAACVKSCVGSDKLTPKIQRISESKWISIATAAENPAPLSVLLRVNPKPFAPFLDLLTLLSQSVANLRDIALVSTK